MKDRISDIKRLLRCEGMLPSPATVIIMLLAVGCAFMAFFTPYNHDDLYYRHVFLPAGSNADSLAGFPSISEFFSFAQNHYLESNGRLGDKLLPLALLLPKWFFSLLTGLAVFFILDAGRFISTRLSSACMRILCATLLLLALPWYDLMFTGAFSVNYLWGGALSLIAFSYMIGLRHTHGSYSRVAVCLLMLVAGSWHEGYAMTVGAGVLSFHAVSRFKADKVQWLYWVLWMCGAAMVVLSPSSWNRMDTSGSDFYLSRLCQSYAIAYFNVALLYLPLLALVLSWRQFRSRASHRILSLLIGVGVMQIVNFYIVGRTYWVGRISIFSSLFVLPSLLLILKLLAPRKILISNVIRVLAACLGTLISVAHLSICLFWQIRLNKEYSTIIQLYRSSDKSEPLYYDLLQSRDIPIFTLGKPSTYQLHNAWGLTTFAQYYGHEEAPLRILPTHLKGIDPAKEGVCVNDKYGIYMVGGELFSRDLGDKRDYKFTYKYDDSRTVRMSTLATTFMTPAGVRYAFLEPKYPPFPPKGTLTAVY